MTTRSAVLCAVKILTRSNNAIYTVPAARVVLLKSLALYNESASPWAVRMYLWRQNPGVAIYFYDQVVEGGGWDQIQTWHVMEPSDELYALISGGPVHFWVSGAILPQSAS